MFNFDKQTIKISYQNKHLRNNKFFYKKGLFIEKRNFKIVFKNFNFY